MNENIKAGSDIHSGDGGYSLGTKEDYDEFVKGRNQSTGKLRIQELADEAAKYSAVMALPTGQSGNELFVAKFAQLIVAECTDIIENLSPGYNDYRDQIEDAFRRACVTEIKQQLGVEE
jgi:hypothetical protein